MLVENRVAKSLTPRAAASQRRHDTEHTPPSTAVTESHLDEYHAS